MSTRLNKKQTWTDPLTGLVWQAQQPFKMSWYDAMAAAKTLDLEGHHDWRLPTIIELESLLDRTKYRPVIRDQVPFKDEQTYWSATTFEENTKNAWIIMFEGAYVLSYYKTNVYHVRFVRGSKRQV